jgi:adenylate cyclase
LPFDCLSRDPDHEFLADGITENLIAILSTSPNVLVISRNSSFVFKGKAAPVQEIAQTLGVRYVVEGSLQVHSDRIRVTAQLIDALTDRHLWADRFDRTLDDIFELQDDISHKICVELHVKLTYGETVRHRSFDVDSLRLFTTGRTHFNHFTPQSYEIAREMWSRFHEFDQKNPEGLALMGWLAFHRVYLGISNYIETDLKEALDYGTRAMEIDANFGNAHRLLGMTALLMRDFDVANAYLDRAIELNPSDGEAISIAGTVRLHSGRVAEAEELLLLSLKLEPFTPTWVPTLLATARMLLGKYDLARAGFEAISRGSEETFVQVAMTSLAILGQLEDRPDLAEKAHIELVTQFPNASVTWFSTLWLRLSKDTDLTAKYEDLLRDTGLKDA